MTNLVYKKEGFLNGVERSVFLTNIGDDNKSILAFYNLTEGIIFSEGFYFNNENIDFDIEINSKKEIIKSKLPIFKLGTYKTDCKKIKIDSQQDEIFNGLEIFLPISKSKKTSELLKENYPVVIIYEGLILQQSIFFLINILRLPEISQYDKFLEIFKKSGSTKTISFTNYDFGWQDRVKINFIEHVKDSRLKGVDIIPFSKEFRKIVKEQNENIELYPCDSKILTQLGIRKIEFKKEGAKNRYEKVKYCLIGKNREILNIYKKETVFNNGIKNGKIYTIYEEITEQDILKILLNEGFIKEFKINNEIYYYHHKGNKLIVGTENLSNEYKIYLQDIDLLLIPVVDKVKFAIEQIKEKIKLANK